METLNGPLHFDFGVGCCWPNCPVAVGLQLVHSVQLRGLAADDFKKQVLPRYTATVQGFRD